MSQTQGKIRVFARIRPMLEFEAAKGQAPALVVPDELTVTHMWKGAPREYNFDAVFAPEATQEQVLFLEMCWYVLLSRTCERAPL